MKTHSLIQGSAEWLAYRMEHYNASEAAAMLGISKTTTRTELMHMMHTGLGKEFSDWVQRNVLDYGHEVEAKVRPLVEVLIGDDLYPVTCSDGKLSASLDGLTMCGEIAFECKQWNAEIAKQVSAGEMPEHHMPQCQQIMMITGAKKVVFAVGDGTTENLLTLDVLPDPIWFDRILKGWEQFAIDLAAYVPMEVVANAVGHTPEALPALRIEVTGMVTASNLAQYKAHALAVFAGINRTLTTDQEFADADKIVKWCGDVEERLAAAKQHALSQTESIDALFRTIDDISAEARTTRLELDKLVKARKEQVRVEIVMEGAKAIASHIEALNVRLGKNYMPAVPADFAGAIKGKRTLESMRDAVATTLANSKIAASAIADKIDANLHHMADVNAPMALFSDLSTICLKAPDDFQLLVKSRVEAEAERINAQAEKARAAIQEEERVKAEQEARANLAAEQAASVKLAAEQAAFEQQERDEIARLAKPNTTMVVEAAPAVTHATVVEIMMPPAVRQAMAPKADTAPTLTLGEISTRLGFNVTSAFLTTLGYEAVPVKAARLYHEEDFVPICEAIKTHISEVQGQFEPVAA